MGHSLSTYMAFTSYCGDSKKINCIRWWYIMEKNKIGETGDVCIGEEQECYLYKIEKVSWISWHLSQRHERSESSWHVFQKERTACTKPLMQKCACPLPEIARRPVYLDWSSRVEQLRTKPWRALLAVGEIGHHWRVFSRRVCL